MAPAIPTPWEVAAEVEFDEPDAEGRAEAPEADGELLFEEPLLADGEELGLAVLLEAVLDPVGALEPDAAAAPEPPVMEKKVENAVPAVLFSDLETKRIA
jgi:hypothetical protein